MFHHAMISPFSILNTISDNCTQSCGCTLAALSFDEFQPLPFRKEGGPLDAWTRKALFTVFGASMHMLSKKVWSPAELETFRKFRTPTAAMKTIDECKKMRKHRCMYTSERFWSQVLLEGKVRNRV